MGYDISISTRDARAAVKRGIATIKTIEGGWHWVLDGDENLIGWEKDPDYHTIEILAPNGASVVMSDFFTLQSTGRFSVHCCYGGSLGILTKGVLSDAGVPFKVKD